MTCICLLNDLILFYLFSLSKYLFYCEKRQAIKVSMNECLEIQSSVQILKSNTANAEGMLGKLRHDF